MADHYLGVVLLSKTLSVSLTADAQPRLNPWTLFRWSRHWIVKCNHKPCLLHLLTLNYSIALDNILLEILPLTRWILKHIWSSLYTKALLWPMTPNTLKNLQWIPTDPRMLTLKQTDTIPTVTHTDTVDHRWQRSAFHHVLRGRLGSNTHLTYSPYWNIHLWTKT